MRKQSSETILTALPPLKQKGIPKGSGHVSISEHSSRQTTYHGQPLVRNHLLNSSVQFKFKQLTFLVLGLFFVCCCFKLYTDYKILFRDKLYSSASFPTEHQYPQSFLNLNSVLQFMFWSCSSYMISDVHTVYTSTVKISPTVLLQGQHWPTSCSLCVCATVFAVVSKCICGGQKSASNMLHFIYKYLFIHMFVLVWMYARNWTWVASLQSLCFSFWESSFTAPGAHWFSQTGRPSDPGSLLSPPPQHWHHRHALAQPRLSMGWSSNPSLPTLTT